MTLDRDGGSPHQSRLAGNSVAEATIGTPFAHTSHRPCTHLFVQLPVHIVPHCRKEVPVRVKQLKPIRKSEPNLRLLFILFLSMKQCKAIVSILFLQPSGHYPLFPLLDRFCSVDACKIFFSHGVARPEEYSPPFLGQNTQTRAF